MELLEDHVYSTNDMRQFFGVSTDTWKKKKEDLLLHLQQYYEYERYYDEIDRRKIDYHIIRKIEDYEPPKSKKERQNVIYSEQIIKVIEKDNRQTPKNISRIIKNNKEIVALNHKDGTIYEYTRVNMRTMFGKELFEGGTMGSIIDKVWCMLDYKNNKYIPLEEEQTEFLYQTFHTFQKESKEYDLSICSEYESGLISKEEMQEILNENSLNCFITAKQIFKTKYGYFPVKVPSYELFAIYKLSAF